MHRKPYVRRERSRNPFNSSLPARPPPRHPWPVGSAGKPYYYSSYPLSAGIRERVATAASARRDADDLLRVGAYRGRGCGCRARTDPGRRRRGAGGGSGYTPVLSEDAGGAEPENPNSVSRRRVAS